MHAYVLQFNFFFMSRVIEHLRSILQTQYERICVIYQRLVLLLLYNIVCVLVILDGTRWCSRCSHIYWLLRSQRLI